MASWLRGVFAGRPWWMNGLMLFCAYMAFFYVPWDFFAKPVAEDQEVWFGFLLEGWAAKATEPLHWLIFAAGAYGFRGMRAWMWPWASLYAAQIAIGMLVWSALDPRGHIALGLVALLPFGALTLALWRARPLFQEERDPPSLRERYGEWALVTGASAGLGEAFARALAREGMSCVLTARREDRLHALASELEKTYSVSTRVVVADLEGPAGPEAVASAVSDLEIGVLVNNAGFGYAGRFDKQEGDRLRAMVQLNCLAPLVLTRRSLPGMLERGRGAVIFTGSIAGRQPLPLHAVYAATKGFELLLGEALHVELEESGIDVLVLEPGATATEFQQVAGEIAEPGEPAEDVVALALASLGRQPTVISGWLNWLRANLATRLLPRPAVAYIARDVIRGQTPESMR